MNRKNKLEEEKEQIRKRMARIEGAEKQWNVALKNIFFFAHHAKMRFKTGNLMTKRKALDYIGSNWTLGDKKLSGDLLKPFVLIDETISGKRSQKPRLQPSEYVGLEPQDDGFDDPNFNWRGFLTDVKTAVLESDHDYTLNIPELIEEEKSGR